MQFFLIFLVCLFSAGCTVESQVPGNSPGVPSGSDRPQKGCPGGVCPIPNHDPQPPDIPARWRVANYAARGEGSCVYATLATAMRWHGRFSVASQWLAVYGGGEVPRTTRKKLAGSRLAYAWRDRGFRDWAFLRRALDLRHPVAVELVTSGRHMALLVSLDSRRAVLLDSNHPARLRTLTIDQFAGQWSGWSIALADIPPPPRRAA